MLWLPLIFFFFLLIDMKMSAQNKKNKTRLLYNVNEPDASISIQMIHAFLCIFKKKIILLITNDQMLVLIL